MVLIHLFHSLLEKLLFLPGFCKRKMHNSLNHKHGSNGYLKSSLQLLFRNFSELSFTRPEVLL
jgi:hypothetical protein